MNLSIYKQKIRLFERKIMDFYRKAGREHLPWRPCPSREAGQARGITAYEVWVSEIMLQQTQVSRVIGYYTKFLERFPTVQTLAQASWEEFLPYYAGLGYYRRGRNMIEAAKKVVNEHGGEFPRDKKLLMKLPGVGDYTASAILSFAYGDNHLAWDTNLKRVIGRFFFGRKEAFSEKYLKQDQQSKAAQGLLVEPQGTKFPLDRQALAVLPAAHEGYARPVLGHLCTHSVSDGQALVSTSSSIKEDKSVCSCKKSDFFERSFASSKKDLNAALMDFGSAVCTGRPKCSICPLRERCEYFQTSGGKEGVTNKIPRQVRNDSTVGVVEKIDWKQAQVLLWLHENHKKYYSAHRERFEPFVIPAEYNSRAGIKDYFKERHSLELAVRPPHKKVIVDGKPTLFVNAQILLGKPGFETFSPEEVREYAEKRGW